MQNIVFLESYKLKVNFRWVNIFNQNTHDSDTGEFLCAHIILDGF